jgi:UDP-GlcNAc:undecaprenyl-phosphate GlcNAc-1-phosphate transferase
MPLSPVLLPLFVLASVGLATLLTPAVRRWALIAKAVDKPTGGRKIHHKATPLWGGLVTGTTIIVALIAILLFTNPVIGKAELHPEQVIGFIVAILVLMIGGALDDRFSLPPAVQFAFPLAASLVIIASGSGILQVTNPAGAGVVSLVWSKITLGSLSLSWPADVVTILWLLMVTYAMKFLDGLDGLAAGMAAIGATLIAVLASSEAYFQPLVALLALMIAGAHLGFLPKNKEGSMFLGEAGSTIAGFSLGVLAIISGAKVATAATALAVPLVDIVLVVTQRLIAGRSPFKGDDSHLHFRLLKAGLSQRAAVRFIWMLAVIFGLIALTLQTQGKIFLLAGLAILVLLISAFAWNKTKRET